MPTLYPKCTPSEVLGFLMLLNNARGSQDLARISDEENLPIDKILPAVEYAQGLGLLTLEEGRASITDAGRMLLAADIRNRKVLLRELLKRTILFRAILRSLEQSVDGTVAEDEIAQIVAFTTAPPEAIQTIINWGRYTELFRYDATRHSILPMGTKGPAKATPVIPLPPSPPIPPVPANSGGKLPTNAKGPAAPRTPASKPAPVRGPSSGAAPSPPAVRPSASGTAPPAPAASAPKKKVPPPAS